MALQGLGIDETVGGLGVGLLVAARGGGEEAVAVDGHVAAWRTGLQDGGAARPVVGQGLPGGPLREVAVVPGLGDDGAEAALGGPRGVGRLAGEAVDVGAGDSHGPFLVQHLPVVGQGEVVALVHLGAELGGDAHGTALVGAADGAALPVQGEAPVGVAHADRNAVPGVEGLDLGPPAAPHELAE